MIPTTLVVGADPTRREQAIADALDPATATALILEGMPAAGISLRSHNKLEVARIAAGCPCCAGNLVLRVTLNRMLRHRPQRIFIALGSEEHLPALRAFLSHPPYENLLRLTQDLRTENRS